MQKSREVHIDVLYEKYCYFLQKLQARKLTDFEREFSNVTMTDKD